MGPRYDRFNKKRLIQHWQWVTLYLMAYCREKLVLNSTNVALSPVNAMGKD